jgi:fatty-acyl-CoA synthase
MDDWYPEVCTTWNRVLENSAQRHAGRELFAFKHERMTYEAFYAAVEDFAKGLLNLGVRRNDVVAIWMTNCLEWAVCQFAIYKVGALLLPVYSYYKEQEVRYALEQAGATTLIMKDDFLGKIDALAIVRALAKEIDGQPREALDCAGLPHLKTIIAVAPREALPSRYSYEEVLTWGRHRGSAAALIERERWISPFDVMNIMYTSGTTGFPKGGMSMHITNLSTVHHWSRLARLGPDDVILCHVPLFTNFGGLYGGALGIRNGCRVVITEQFDAGESLRLIEQERVTYVPGTPSMFRMLLDHPDFGKHDLSSLRGGHVAGAPLTAATMQEIIETLGAREIMQAWGMSECGGLSTVSTAEHPLDKRLNSVGRPLPSSRVLVVNPETLEELPAGQPGEICLADVHPGSCVGKGYFRMPEKTRAVLTDEGWFRTGDVGYSDAEGYLYVVGRVDDMFTVGGFNIYPAEIENTLEKLPAIREAFIVPLADRRLVNVPVAWIAREEGTALDEQAVIAHAKATLSAQKVPRRVFFYTPGELPMTASGKVKKKDLTQLTAERVAAGDRAGADRAPADSSRSSK